MQQLTKFDVGGVPVDVEMVTEHRTEQWELAFCRVPKER